MSLPSPLAAALRQAQALRDAGDLTTARVMLEDAVDAARPMLGDDHPELLGGQHALATLHREADDPAAARRVLEEALAAGELHLGEANPLMLALSFDLGTVAEELGNRHEARRNFTRVATHGRAAFGEDHHMVRTATAYLSTAGGELPPLPPLQSTVAPPPPPAGGWPAGPPAGQPTGWPPAAVPPGQAPGLPTTGPAMPAGPGPSTSGPAMPAGPGPSTAPHQPGGPATPPNSAWGTGPGDGQGGFAGPPRPDDARAAGHGVPQPLPPTAGPGPTAASDAGGSAFGGQGGPATAGAWSAGAPADPSQRAGHEVAPGVFAPPWNGADAAQAARAAIDAPTQALPTQGAHPPGVPPVDARSQAGRHDATSAPAGPPNGGSAPWGPPPQSDAGPTSPGNALGWGSPAPSTPPPSSADAWGGAAPGQPGNAGGWEPDTTRPGSAAAGNVAPHPTPTGQPGNGPSPIPLGQPGGPGGWGESSPDGGAWGRELAPARERLPQAFGQRPGPEVAPGTAVEVAPVSLHGPMLAAAARERARGRSATVAAFVAAAAAVVATLLVLTMVLRKETEPPRIGAVPEISAGAPVPIGPALGGDPPTDLVVREDGDALLLTWTDPTAGTVPFIVAAGPTGTQLRAMATIEPGATRYLANGLSDKFDYCFTVVAVYSTDKYAASGQVCTTRTADAPR